ncbi:hypothetical protein DPMN_112751 [Dreissena polymorpha]|uniref:Peptidylglycine monooxygenase n=1 Tax=Dreissena polymorpha TaxID=45954 RepID=A0A9D4QQB0_DREPO|nr:hypothetical protein DPMN_112751 [Dreissena polymorpha]
MTKQSGTQLWTLLLQSVTLVTLVCAQVDKRNCSIDHSGLPSDACTFDLRMRGAQPKQSDQYYCTGYSVSRDILGSNTDGYILRYEAIADAGTAHHILVFGCEQLEHDKDSMWSCGKVCVGDQIIFAWAKNADPLTLPKDVGQHIGKGTSINFIVVQIHYVVPLQSPDTSGIRLYTTQQRQKYISGIYLLLSYGVSIPPDTEKVHIDSACTFDWEDSIIPIGYRTHAHSLGKVISGYKVHNGVYEMIGKGNPQWPQAFYPVTSHVEINPGDVLAARCTFSSIGRHRKTEIGATANDEMCNFYIMYYMNATLENNRGRGECLGNSVPLLFDSIPADSDTPLPPNPALEDVAMGHHHHSLNGENKEESEKDDTALKQSIPNPVTKPQSEHPHDQGKLHNLGATMDPAFSLKFDGEVGGMKIGQVGGLAVNGNGDLYIFHRGDIVWNSLSFDDENRYTLQNRPIEVDSIVIVDRNGTLKRSFAKNWFFMPHGLTVDSDGNMYVTDVALHQVFRILPSGDKVDMTLGMRFEPGSDNDHFCKPTDVAVLKNGDFFVSDGYCNNRILKFNKNGYVVSSFGSSSTKMGLDGYPPPSTFFLPHGLTLAEDKGQLCVADRENGRIQCFALDGTFIRQIHPPQFGRAVYALEYSPNHNGLLFAVNGPDVGVNMPDTEGFTIDINTGNLLAVWNRPSGGLMHPHDLAVDDRDHVVYVGELNPSKVWKFKMDQTMYSALPQVSVDNNSNTVATTAANTIIVSSNSGKNTNGSLNSNKDLNGANSKPNVGNKVAGNVNNIDLTHTAAGNKGLAGAKDHATSADQANDLPKTESIDTEDGMGASLIIGALLVVPVLILIVITILVRLYHTVSHLGTRGLP